MEQPLIKLNQITKVYEGSNDENHTVLDGVTLEIRHGEIFGLLGPNGAGKTTLIKILLGLTKPSSGSVMIEGISVPDHLEAKKIIGYVPEKVSFYGNLTALETLRFFSDLKGVPRIRCHEVLEQVGMGKSAGERVANLSKGMLQRVGVAQALLAKPKLLILDEPTSGLDPIGVVNFKQLLHELNAEGITILFTSHIMSEVEDLAARIAILKAGKLLATDFVAAIKQKTGGSPKMEITLKNPSGDIVDRVLGVGASSARLDDIGLHVECQPWQKAEILSAIRLTGVEILDLRTIEPSLEEIFVKVLSSEKVTLQSV